MLLCRLPLLRNRPAIGSAITEFLLSPSLALPHGACVRVLCCSGFRVCGCCVVVHPAEEKVAAWRRTTKIRISQEPGFSQQEPPWDL